MSSLRPSHAIFAVLKKKEPCKSFNQYLHFSNYVCQPCTGAMQILFKSLTCHPSRGHAALLLLQKKKVRVILAQRVMQILCAEKNVQPIRKRREKRHSCTGSPRICGRLFRDIRTFGRAVEGSSVSPLTNTMGGLSGGGRGVDTSGVSSAPTLKISRLRARALALDLDCGTCCPPFVIRKAHTIQGSSTPRRKSSAMRKLYCSTRCARRSTSLASVLGPSTLLARGDLLVRGRASSPLSAAAVLLPALPRGESDRVQAEHDARPAFLALHFLARLRSTVPYVRRQLHRRALHHVALPVRLQHRNVFWCQLPRCRQTAQERSPTHARTEDRVALGRLARSASGLLLIAPADLVVESTCLCPCFGHAL